MNIAEQLKELNDTANVMVPLIKSRIKETPEGEDGMIRIGSLTFKRYCPEDCPSQQWVNFENSKESYIAICCEKHR